jgi:tetratricopeptide (TPR) repeat protein
MEVNAWIEKIMIPTYKVGEPDKNPMFLEKRVYQGSSGVVYPHPVIEHISDEKTDIEYTAVFLENDYLKIMILPEIGGRIQRAYDKVQQRDFVYYNEVIKPALVGLAGPWISGGIEFNWPQHHRPSTFSPIDFTIEDNSDGSKTVWVNEIEVMFRTKGMAGFTLYPDKAYIEIKGKLFNRSLFPQTFLWWANPAVKVNEHYQSIFPPDVYAVFDHGKRDVSDFPVATGTYYKVDYSPGTDISRYDTIPVPTSYMAIKSKYDFMGCYEHDTQAGMLHVANHHFSPGKKQWTWGNGDFGYAWDRSLTDENGPYIELMTGVFTDNQPDFSWLQPNESKTFEQYFMPYASIGNVKNATKEALLNVEFSEQSISLKVYTTAVYTNALIQLYYQESLLKTFEGTISPAQIAEYTFNHSEIITKPEDWKVSVWSEVGDELVSYQPEIIEEREIPEAAVAAKRPQEIEHIEDLFLNGLHLEQYRHATYNPADYYEEGLRRNPDDSRCNNAMGLLNLRRGQFEKAIPFFKKAIQTITKRNPNPYDGEAYYNLGYALRFQGKIPEAYEAFYKATWNDAWQQSAFFALARIDSADKKWKNALALVDKSLVRNYNNPSVRHLKTALLRHSNQVTEALELVAESIKIDAFNVGCLFEKYLILQTLTQENLANETRKNWLDLMRDCENNYLELSLDYAHAGLFEEAILVLTTYKSQYQTASPLTHYYLGWFYAQLGNAIESTNSYQEAAKIEMGLCFPNKIEEILILQDALVKNPSDAKASYYLGNLWYDKKHYSEAIECWEKSVSIEPNFPTPYRNLSLAYYNKLNEKTKALIFMEKAFALDKNDARVLMELDQLYKITGKSTEQRLAFLDNFPHLLVKRDDLYLEKITLLNNAKRFLEAKELLANRQFHPWEGGEGKVVGQYLLCHIELAKQAIAEREYDKALSFLEATETYPENLGEGKLFGVQENDRFYLLGCVYEGLGLTEKAITYFKQATVGISEPMQAIYYNDPQPDKIIYQALSWTKLGELQRAKTIFERFITFGEKHENDEISIDYFAVSLPDMLVFDIDLNLRNNIHCQYLKSLGLLGLGRIEEAKTGFQAILNLDQNHQGAMIHLEMIPFFENNTALEWINA